MLEMSCRQVSHSYTVGPLSLILLPAQVWRMKPTSKSCKDNPSSTNHPHAAHYYMSISPHIRHLPMMMIPWTLTLDISRFNGIRSKGKNTNQHVPSSMHSAVVPCRKSCMLEGPLFLGLKDSPRSSIGEPPEMPIPVDGCAGG